MSRVFPAAVAFVFFAASGATQSTGVPTPQNDERPDDERMTSAIKLLDRAQYGEALAAFDRALDSYAAAQRLNDVRRTYMQMFVGNRAYAGILMKAMKTWVQKHRTGEGGLPGPALAEFEAWVHERDALAAATVNLAHNSPDWK